MASHRPWPGVRLVLAFLAITGGAVAQGEEGADDLPALLQDAQRKLARNQLSAAEQKFEELQEELAAEPDGKAKDALANACQIGLWTIALRRGRYEDVRDGVRTAAAELRTSREGLLMQVQAQRRLGDYGGAIALLQGLVERDAGDLQARHELGELFAADGQRGKARELWQQNVDRPAPTDGLQLAFRGRSLVALSGRKNLEAASQALVDSIKAAPDRKEARVTLGLAKFAAYGETSGFPSGEKDLKKVLEDHGDDEEALLAMYRIRSANMSLDAGKTEGFLDRVLDRNERCVAAIVQRGANVLDDRRYRDAAKVLDTALAIDANDREALCHRAAAAYLLHDRDGYERFRARALAGDPGFPDCDRTVAEHLCALYRFADSLPFFAAALQLAPDDVPSLQGMAKALVYSGEGKRAKELLERSKQLAAGLVDAWRNNALAVQQLLDDEYIAVDSGAFAFQLHRDDDEVLRNYLLPIQLEAAEVLGAKYAWKPDRPTHIEVFHTWDDFSVRTIGFRGFTALGACFGSLITLVSPGDTDLRKQDFMWEATAWHEYTHVLTLGLSNARVPRWLTEGFSVYEEKQRDPSWERGMDRELFDAFHNQDIPPVHLMNRLFRGPRILFGYYQGGLVIELITKLYGFGKALDLLRAFGEDLDTEEAFEKALGISSREFDRQFLDYVQKEKLRGMRLVPHLDDAAMGRAALRAAQDPTNLQARIDLAWACAQRNNPVDAGRWLGEVLRADPEHGQAMLVRAELARARKELPVAIGFWQKGFAAGADDFDSRIQCGKAMAAGGDADGAIAMWQRAKACWPSCTDQTSAPELLLARLYRDQGEAVQAQMEMKAYCRRSARAFTPRYTLAQFERDSGNRAEELRYLTECNRIDPFHRELHERMGEACEALGKRPQAALEFEMAAAVSPAMDRRFVSRPTPPPADDDPEQRQLRGDLLLRAARLRHELGDAAKAVALLERIQKAAPGTEAATTAASLQQEWRGR